MAEPLHERNRRSWNAVTPAHQSHKPEQAAFLRGGGSTLFPEELELLGPVAGLRLLHLQCNCGQDSLSLARLGAEVVGVDIADVAIAEASALSQAAGIPAAFERGEAIEWLRATADSTRRFDVAFASYGAIGWIEDLDAWMHGVAGVLDDCGRLVLLEFHPAAWSVDAHGHIVESYFIADPIEEPAGVRDYVGRSGEGLTPMGFADGIEGFENPEPAVSFQHTVAGIVQSAADAGLRIETLREYPFANGCAMFDGMRQLPGRRFVRSEGVPDLPLMLGLVARRRA